MYLAIFGDLFSVYLIIVYELLSNVALLWGAARLTIGVPAISLMTLGVSTIPLRPVFQGFRELDLAEYISDCRAFVSPLFPKYRNVPGSLVEWPKEFFLKGLAVFVSNFLDTLDYPVRGEFLSVRLRKWNEDAPLLIYNFISASVKFFFE